jgi:hypothetical protein
VNTITPAPSHRAKRCGTCRAFDEITNTCRQYAPDPKFAFEAVGAVVTWPIVSATADWCDDWIDAVPPVPPQPAMRPADWLPVIVIGALALFGIWLWGYNRGVSDARPNPRPSLFEIVPQSSPRPPGTMWIVSPDGSRVDRVQ